VNVEHGISAVGKRVSIRAHFERFPATIKGAFVLRAADRDPHLVQILSAMIVELGSRDRQPIGLAPMTLDVAPTLDLFVPFEFAVTDLGPGWYGLECELIVDGDPTVVRPGDRFPVPWPRATVRRGAVAVGKAVEASGAKVRLEQIDCAGDSIRVGYSAPRAATLKLSADGATMTVIDEEYDEEAGRGRVTAYPLLKTQSRLSIEVRGAPAAVEIRLP
jgi:hypothetical protein